MKDMTRRKFLHIGGSAALALIVGGAAGTSIWKMFSSPDKLFFGKTEKQASDDSADEQIVSPYRRTFGFETPDDVAALDIMRGNIVIATTNTIYTYGVSGEIQSSFSVTDGVRDIAAFDDKIYVLYPTRVEVFTPHGESVNGWEACSANADYCSITVFDGGVFVTDAGGKNVCKYTLEGALSRFINSPKGFVVPSYSFGITNIEGSVFVSNPGRHLIEQYTSEGEYVTAFGKGGNADGAFSGCCNPVILASNAAGEILTSEKGKPRISCYGQDGKFHSVMLDSKALDGGREAYRVKVLGNKLVVARGKKISVYQYNRRASEGTLCGDCNKECPLKP